MAHMRVISVSKYIFRVRYCLQYREQILSTVWRERESYSPRTHHQVINDGQGTRDVVLLKRFQQVTAEALSERQIE